MRCQGYILCDAKGGETVSNNVYDVSRRINGESVYSCYIRAKTHDEAVHIFICGSVSMREIFQRGEHDGMDYALILSGSSRIMSTELHDFEREELESIVFTRDTFGRRTK